MRTKSRVCFGILLSIVFILMSSSAFSTPQLARLLYKAIEVGDLDKAKVLLAGTDINAQDSLGYTPLYKAVFYNRLDFIKYLFELGANVNLGDFEGLAPLHVAALENLPDIIEILKDEGATLKLP
jgi:ankyrin repeat protein